MQMMDGSSCTDLMIQDDSSIGPPAPGLPMQMISSNTNVLHDVGSDVQEACSSSTTYTSRVYAVREPDNPEVIVGWMTKAEAHHFYKGRRPTCPRCLSNQFVRFRYLNNVNKGGAVLQPRYLCALCHNKCFTLFGKLRKLPDHRDVDASSSSATSPAAVAGLLQPTHSTTNYTNSASSSECATSAPINQHKYQGCSNKHKKKADINVINIQMQPQIKYYNIYQPHLSYNVDQKNVYKQQFNISTASYEKPLSANQSTAGGTTSYTSQQLYKYSPDLAAAGPNVDQQLLQLSEPTASTHHNIVQEFAGSSSTNDFLRLPPPEATRTASDQDLNIYLPETNFDWEAVDLEELY